MVGLVLSSAILFVSVLLLLYLHDLIGDVIFEGFTVHVVPLDLFLEIDLWQVDDVSGIYWYLNEHTHMIRVKSAKTIRSSIIDDLKGVNIQFCDENVQLDVYDECVTKVHFIYCSEQLFGVLKRKVRRLYQKQGYRRYSKMNHTNVRKIS